MCAELFLNKLFEDLPKGFLFTGSLNLLNRSDKLLKEEKDTFLDSTSEVGGHSWRNQLFVLRLFHIL